MTELREDIRCRNCGGYASEELEKVATLLDELLSFEDYPDDHDNRLKIVDELIDAWKKV